MGSRSAGTRRLLPALALTAVVIGVITTLALAAGPGGWDHLGDRGTTGSDSLDLVASALTVTPGVLYVGGDFTDAGGNPAADRIATWNGSSWGTVSSAGSQISNGGVSAIAVTPGKVFAGGTFQNAGGNANADFLAVWNGRVGAVLHADRAGHLRRDRQQPADRRPDALRRRGVPERRGHRVRRLPARLRPDDGARELHGRRPGPPVLGHRVRAGGRQQRHALRGRRVQQPARTSPPPTTSPTGRRGHAGTRWARARDGCECAVTGFVRGLTTVGTDAYIGTDANDVAGIAQADHVARWAGTEWRPWAPAPAARTDGSRRRPRSRPWPGPARTSSPAGRSRTPTATRAPTTSPSSTAPPGTRRVRRRRQRPVERQRPRARARRPPALCGWELHQRRRRRQAHSVASFALSQIIAYPTPTVTAGPGAVPTPTVTQAPNRSRRPR